MVHGCMQYVAEACAGELVPPLASCALAHVFLFDAGCRRARALQMHVIQQYAHAFHMVSPLHAGSAVSGYMVLARDIQQPQECLNA